MVTDWFDLEPIKTAGGNRDLWFNTMYFDSRKLSIDCERHYSKVALHKYDPWVTYWRKNGGDLRQIAKAALGQSITDMIDELTRDAFLSSPFWLMAGDHSDIEAVAGYPDFNILETTDTFDPDIAQKVWLIMDEKDVPMANDPSGLGGRTMFAVTTPGVWYDQITTSGADGNFKEKLEILQDRELLMNYEVGSYMNTRYIKTRRNILYNCGTVVLQTTLTADISIGSGHAATVDTVYTPGQASLRTSSENSDAGQNYISLASVVGLVVGDIITIHSARTSNYGVTNGVDFKHGNNTERRIVSISGNNVALDKPVLKREYVQGEYVTKAMHIHATIFVGGPNAVVWAVTQSPALYQPPTIDDGMGQARFSWDMYAKPQTFRPEFAYVVFSAATSSEGMLPNG